MTKVFGQHAGQPKDLFATIKADPKIAKQVSAQEVVAGKAQPGMMLQNARLTTDPDSILDGIELVVLDKPVHVREPALNGQTATTTAVEFMISQFGVADLEHAIRDLVTDIGHKFGNTPFLVEEIIEVNVYLNRIGYDLAEQAARQARFSNYTESFVYRVYTGHRQFGGTDHFPLVASEVSDMVDSYPRNAIAFKTQDTGRDVRMFIENAGLNFIDQTSYDAIPEATLYFLSPDNHHVGEEGYITIAQNPSHPLYLYATDADHAEHDNMTVLTREEAAVVSTGRIFHDVTSLGVIAQARAMQPYILADRAVLNKMKAAVAGYYHAQDLDLATIQAKLAFWQDALDAATAGSVELAAAALESMSAAGPGTNYQEVYLDNGSINWDGAGTYNWIYYTPWNLGIQGAVSDPFFWIGKQRPSWWVGVDQFFVRLKTSNFATLSADYTTIKFTAESGTVLSLNVADAVTDASEPDYYYWGFQAQGGVTDDVEAQAITNEIGEYSQGASTYWVLSLSNAIGTADNELVELALNDLNQHLVKFPR